MDMALGYRAGRLKYGFEGKRFIVACCLALITVIGFSCKKVDYLLKNDDSAVYFYDEDKLPTDSFRVAAFGYLDQDTVIRLPVKLLGPLSTKDRKYSCVVVEEGTSAEQGKAFTLDGNAFVIAGGAYTDTVRIRVFNQRRAASSAAEQILLEIRPSEAFNNLLLDKDPIVVDRYYEQYYNRGNIYQAVIKIDYSAPAPVFWTAPDNVPFFGAYSPKKAQAFIKWTGVDVRCFTERESLIIYTDEELQQMAMDFAVYLETAYRKGDPVLDEDGRPMQMGAALTYPL